MADPLEVVWQNMLLADIIDSGAAGHPFTAASNRPALAIPWCPFFIRGRMD
jgi:hypothetical protein